MVTALIALWKSIFVVFSEIFSLLRFAVRVRRPSVVVALVDSRHKLSPQSLRRYRSAALDQLSLLESLFFRCGD